VSENKGYRADSNLVPSTLRVVTTTLVQGYFSNLDVVFADSFISNNIKD
jgi:hypothetical protein